MATSPFTARELFDQHIQRPVAGRSEQVPQYTAMPNSGDSGGDFVFFPKQQPLAPLQEKWALVVGVSRFDDQRIPPLNYSVGDARDFALALTDKGIGRFREDHLFVLTDEMATLRGIRTALNGLLRRAGRNDLVVLCFVSHVSPRYMDVRGEQYFITYDTRIERDALPATALPLTEIYDFVRDRVPAQRALLLMDGCSSVPNYDYERPHDSGRVTAIIEGCDGNSGDGDYESVDLHHGYFMYYVLDALRSSHGRISPTELFNSVRDKVSSRVMQDMRKHQTPFLLIGGNDSGVMIGQAEHN